VKKEKGREKKGSSNWEEEGRVLWGDGQACVRHGKCIMYN